MVECRRSIASSEDHHERPQNKGKTRGWHYIGVCPELGPTNKELRRKSTWKSVKFCPNCGSWANTLVRLQEESPGQGHVALRMGPRSPGSGLEQRDEPADPERQRVGQESGLGEERVEAGGQREGDRPLAQIEPITPKKTARIRGRRPRTASSSGPIGSRVRTSAVSPTSPWRRRQREKRPLTAIARRVRNRRSRPLRGRRRPAAGPPTRRSGRGRATGPGGARPAAVIAEDVQGRGAVVLPYLGGSSPPRRIESMIAKRSSSIIGFRRSTGPREGGLAKAWAGA